MTRDKKNIGKFHQDFRVQGSPELTHVLQIKPSALYIIDMESVMLISTTLNAQEGIGDGPLSTKWLEEWD